MPWNTEFVKGVSREHFPPTATLDTRGSSQLAKRPWILGCRCIAASFFVIRFAHTRSNAPLTSEQYTPTKKPCSISNSQDRTDSNRASWTLVPLPYANCRSPYAPLLAKPLEQVAHDSLRHFRQLWGQVNSAIILRVGSGFFLEKLYHPVLAPAAWPAARGNHLSDQHRQWIC